MAEALADFGVREQPQTQAATFGATMTLAAKHGLPSYDASNLELAVRLQLPLANLDEPLNRAAHAVGVVLMSG